jgi:hypothetical protein
MNVKQLTTGLVCSLILSLQPAFAALISAETTHVSGNTWQSNYTITNDSLNDDIEWFAIYFESGLYTNLVNASTPSINNDWDILIQQPDDPFVGDDGWFDAFAWADGIKPGESLTHFIVQFDYWGTSSQIVQYFEIYDATSQSLDPIGSGEFESSAIAASAPGSLSLFLVSFMAFAALRKTKSRQL